MENIFYEPPHTAWDDIIRRPLMDLAALEDTVRPVLNDIRTAGDAAIKRYALKFEGRVAENLEVSAAQIAAAGSGLSTELKTAIQLAKKNITCFHAAQTGPAKKIQTTEGIQCWRKAIAIARVGLYIPGGTAPLFSTLLMLGIPALLAGCNDIVVCTPAGKDGEVHPAVLYTAQLLGLHNILKIGGIQAIGAMAYGTATIQKVNKIFGPGNQYVTCAKQLVNRDGVAIDMPAGPSEVAVYADQTAVPSFVAADLLSQAEHGTDSQVMLVASTGDVASEVQAQLRKQLTALPKRDTAAEALTHSRWVVIADPQKAFDLLNAYAPEHLIIASDRAAALAEMVINAGSVFLGNYSPESAGDYASGTNHTLPTNGYAKAYSGLSVDSFIRQVTFQQLTKKGIETIGPSVAMMAEQEGLAGHKRAIMIRLAHNPKNSGYEN